MRSLKTVHKEPIDLGTVQNGEYKEGLFIGFKYKNEREFSNILLSTFSTIIKALYDENIQLIEKDKMPYIDNRPTRGCGIPDFYIETLQHKYVVEVKPARDLNNQVGAIGQALHYKNIFKADRAIIVYDYENGPVINTIINMNEKIDIIVIEGNMMKVYKND